MVDRGAHLFDRDLVEQGAHVAQMADRHADLAHFTPGQNVVGVVAGLGRQIEGDRQAGLALGQVAPIELIGLGGRGVAGIGAEQPRLVGRVLEGFLLSWPRLMAPHVVRCNMGAVAQLLPVGPGGARAKRGVTEGQVVDYSLTAPLRPPSGTSSPASGWRIARTRCGQAGPSSFLRSLGGAFPARASRLSAELLHSTLAR